MLNEFIKTDIQLAEYIPLPGLKFRELPNYLAKKNALVNVQNTDNSCFRYAVLSALPPCATNPHRRILH